VIADPPARGGEQRLADLVLAAVDLETTGLSFARGDRILEVAVVVGRRGETPRAWSSLVNPGRPVAATHIHGITDTMVRDQPPFAALVPVIAEQIAGTVLVAHNAPFDMGFLNHECAAAGHRLPEVPVLDTLGLARRVLGLGDHRLATLCERFQLRRDRAHRALDDAFATWKLAWLLADAADPSGGLSVGHALHLARRRTASEVDAVVRHLEAARARGRALVVDYISGVAPDTPPTRRTITVQKVTRSRVVAFCHLRTADRTFRLDRLRIVGEGVTPGREE
jgi:DNA polymerase III epsilon subunit family exonuclease